MYLIEFLVQYDLAVIKYRLVQQTKKECLYFPSRFHGIGMNIHSYTLKKEIRNLPFNCIPYSIQSRIENVSIKFNFTKQTKFSERYRRSKSKRI